MPKRKKVNNKKNFFLLSKTISIEYKRYGIDISLSRHLCQYWAWFIFRRFLV